MSTGAECRFTEDQPGRWSYWLQSWPYGDSPDGQTFGPFATFARAHDHLNQNHANPGGYSTTIHPTGHVHEFTTDEVAVWVNHGVEVTVAIESLGNEPTTEAILVLLRSGAVGEEHLRVRPRQRLEGRVITHCEPCGTEKESQS